MQNLSHQFLEWVRTKPAEEPYNYFDSCGCAYYQFLNSIGARVVAVGGDYWRDREGNRHVIPTDLAERIAADPETFGALADRLEKVLGK